MRVDLAIFDGFDELDVVAPLEILRRARFDVRLCTSGGQTEARGAHGLVIKAEGECRDDAQLLLFPGGGWNARSARGAHAEVEHGRWTSIINRARARGATLASVCTGAMILASAGVLRGRRSTTHRGALADLKASGAIVVRERVVDDGDVITAGGVTSGIDLGLHLVERFASRELARRIAEELEYSAR